MTFVGEGLGPYLIGFAREKSHGDHVLVIDNVAIVRSHDPNWIRPFQGAWGFVIGIPRVPTHKWNHVSIWHSVTGGHVAWLGIRVDDTLNGGRGIRFYYINFEEG